MDLTKKYYLIGTVGIGIVLIIASFFMGWKVNGWIYARQMAELVAGYEKQLGTIDRAANQQLTELQAKKKQLEQELSAFETKAFQELEDEKVKNNQLINALASSERRLRVAVTASNPPGSDRMSYATAASGMGNERATADIDPRDAAAIIRIVNRGDEAIKQLNACQEYFKKTVK